MNICFLYGKIISQINFQFFYNSRIHTSVVTIFIATSKDKNPILVKAYDLVADVIYKNYKQGDYIGLIGNINRYNVIVRSVEPICKLLNIFT